MTDKEKIRAEIERRIEELQPCNTRENLRAHGAIAGYYQILSFINSMQEEPVSEVLLCAADSNSYKYIESVRGAAIQAFEDGAKWQRTKDESTTEDLGEYINKLSKQFPEVSFAKLSRIAVRVAKWQLNKIRNKYEKNRD